MTNSCSEDIDPGRIRQLQNKYWRLIGDFAVYEMFIIEIGFYRRSFVIIYRAPGTTHNKAVKAPLPSF